MMWLTGILNVGLALFCGTVLAFIVFVLWESCDELKKIHKFAPFIGWVAFIALYMYIAAELLWYAEYTGWTP